MTRVDRLPLPAGPDWKSLLASIVLIYGAAGERVEEGGVFGRAGCVCVCAGTGWTWDLEVFQAPCPPLSGGGSGARKRSLDSDPALRPHVPRLQACSWAW